MPGKSGSKLVGAVALYGKAGAAAAIVEWVEAGQHKTEAVGWTGEHKEKPGLPSLTEALWIGCRVLRKKGLEGRVAVHVQRGGEGLVAECELASPPWFGSLKFGAGPTYTVSAEEIMQAAAKGEV